MPWEALMPDHESQSPPLRRAELVAALSLATDLGTGQPLNHALRACVLATHLGGELGLDEAELHTVYYVALLRSAGCVADAHVVASRFGDEITANAAISLIDPADVRAMLGLILRQAGAGKPFIQRVGAVGAALAAGTGERDSVLTAHCEVAEMLAARLGFGQDVARALGQVFERWDGKGSPYRLKGDAIARPARIVTLARDAELFYGLGGLESVTAIMRQRAGAMYDPAIVERFLKVAAKLFALVDSGSPWEATLNCEPGARRVIAEDEFDDAARAIADFVDLKSRFTVHHSTGVAALAEAAGRSLALPEASLVSLRRAALLHDLGRIAISVAIWEKPGALTEDEWERVRLHPYYTERVLARPRALAALGALAAQHHERLDGSGYYRQTPGSLLSMSARTLAAADVYHAMTEPRPHRPPLAPDVAASALRAEARAGRLDSDAVNAVLAAAGHARKAPRRIWPAGLSDREVEVLRLIARGATYRETARTLVISERTVEHHVRHIFDKLGVSTRAAATYFAMRHNLLADGATGAEGA
jgi:HD-GYP domain-containing protein (c-di-GMP phosphodiesterase class II)/DNA-binding CsgD family transcriptional regulator